MEIVMWFSLVENYIKKDLEVEGVRKIGKILTNHFPVDLDPM